MRKKIYIFILLSIITLTIISFNIYTSSSKFKNEIQQNEIELRYISLNNTVDKIEYSVKLGKKLDNFYGIERYFDDLKKSYSDIESCFILGGNKEILFSSSDKLLLDLDNLDEIYSKDGYRVYSIEDKYFFQKDIYGENENVDGSFCFVTSKENILKQYHDYIGRIINFGLKVFLASIVLFLILLTFKNLSMKRLQIFVISIMLIGQLSIGYFNVVNSQSIFESIGDNVSLYTSRIIENEINRLESYNIYQNNISGISKWINEISDNMAYVEKIEISNQRIPASGSEIIYNYNMDIQSKNQFINIMLSRNYLNRIMLDFSLQLFIITIISILLNIEVFNFVSNYFINKNITDKERMVKYIDKSKVFEYVAQIRYAIFILFTIKFLMSPFIPAIASNLYNKSIGISSSLFISISVSLDFLGTAISILIGGGFIEKRGWRNGFIVGTLLMAVGYFTVGFFISFATLIISRMVAGFGFGLALLSLRSFSVYEQDNVKRSKFIANMNTGAIAGLNCGVAIGGLVAENFGYNILFKIAFIVTILLTVYSKIFLKEIIKDKRDKFSIIKKIRYSFKDFLFKPRIMLFLILIFIPNSIMYMYLEYFFPIYSNGANFSDSMLSFGFLLNSLIISLFGIKISEIMTRRFSSGLNTIYANIISILGIAIFALNPSSLTMFISLAVLGISSSFGGSAMLGYFFRNMEVDLHGKSKVVSIQGGIEKIAQFLGPYIFGLVLIMGQKSGLLSLCFIFTIFTVVFAISLGLHKEKAHNE